MSNKIYKLSVIAISLYVLPNIVFAFPANLGGVIDMLIDIVLAIIPFLGAVAFLIFIWGVGRFIRAAGNEKEIKDSKNLLIWGVIGLFILVTIWGIMSFLKSEFGFGGTVGIPQIQLKNITN